MASSRSDGVTSKAFKARKLSSQGSRDGAGRASGATVQVLIVEDEARLLRLLQEQLSACGFQVWTANDGKSALKFLARRPNIVLLDLRLPDMDGLQLLRAMRRTDRNLPIVVLSRVADGGSKVAALDLGADDYVTKPFGISELHARVRAALRHAGQPSVEQRVLVVGDLFLDLEERTVRVRDRAVKLSAKEYQLLRSFVQHAGKALTHDFLLNEIWGGETDPQLLRVFIRSLRQKIEHNPEQPSYILTERGIGYRLSSM
jgi:two-component system, OmpR family, KDP operon response regulator KdpE